MPGSVVIALAGLAAGTWKEMWKLYNERYGKWGEEVVRRLQREVQDAKAENASYNKMLDVMGEQLARAKEQASYRLNQWLAADARANELAARLNSAMCRLERADLPPNPYDEGEPGVPEPTEMDP
jgi:hypothetical protein